MIYGMGMMELGVTFSLVQLAVDDMIVNNIKNIIQANFGLHKISDPEWLNYLVGKGFPASYRSPHRVRGINPDDAGKRPAGRLDAALLAQQKVLAILKHHKPEPLPGFARQRIREIILEAEERKARK